MPTSSEQKQILEMLSSGRLSVDQAQLLLDKVGAVADETPEVASDPEPKATGAKSQRRPHRSHIRISIHEDGDDPTNIRIPIGFARAGLKMKALLPKWVHGCVVVDGCDMSDLTELSPEELEDLDLVFESKGGRVHISAE